MDGQLLIGKDKMKHENQLKSPYNNENLNFRISGSNFIEENPKNASRVVN